MLTALNLNLNSISDPSLMKSTHRNTDIIKSQPRSLSFLSIFLFTLSAFHTSSASEAQEPPRLRPPNDADDNWMLEWEGYRGRTYFLQNSTNLKDWLFSPEIEFGDGLKQVHQIIGSPREFYRLDYTDLPVTSLEEARKADFDADGLSNQKEVEDHGTSPLIPDSDNDQLPDGWEIAHSLNPTDDGRSDPERGPSGIFRPLSAPSPAPPPSPDGSAPSPAPTTNLDAYRAGVQAHPQANLQDLDGDGLPDPVDAGPRSRVIDWRTRSMPSFVAITIPGWNQSTHSLPIRLNDRNEVLTTRAIWRNDQWHSINGNFSSGTIGQPLAYDFIINGRRHGCRVKLLQLSSLGNDGLILGSGTLSIDHLTEIDPVSGSEITYYPGHTPKFCFIWSNPSSPPEIVNRILSQPIQGEFHDEDGMMARDGSLVLRKKTGGTLANLWRIERHKSVYNLIDPEIYLNITGVSTVRPGTGGFTAFGNLSTDAAGQPSSIKSWVWEAGEPVRSIFSAASLSDGPAPVFSNFPSWIGDAPGGKPCISLGGLTFIQHEGQLHQVDTLHGATHMTTTGTAVIQSSITDPLIWNGGAQWLLKNSVRNLGPTDTTLRVIDSNDRGTMLASINENLSTRRLALLVPMEIVPDFNRDGRINDDDRARVTPGVPWRWWVNDDDDWSDGQGADIPDASAPDHANNQVDGMRDLIDFFPLHLDLTAILNAFPTARYEYLIKHSEAAFKYLEFPDAELEPNSDRRAFGPGSHFLDVARGKLFEYHALQAANSTGERLSEAYLLKAKEGKGVLLFEATKETDKPLQLEIRRNGEPVVILDFPVRTSKVEKMYRHLDLTQVPKNYDGSHPGMDPSPLGTVTTNPEIPYPDHLTNGKYFVFIHGFNVTPQQARGWNSETFKRMHQMGSRARFVGVVWSGATGIPGIIPDLMTTDYHKAAFFGFQTGDSLKSSLAFTTGSDITLAAHSLGNLVASQAIQGTNFTPNRYYIINGAVPLEAYDSGSTTAVEKAAMTERTWKNYGAIGERRLFANNWHKLFDENDSRSRLTWSDHFSNISEIDTHNFFSRGEDVVQNPETDDVDIFAEILALTNNQGGFVRGTWGAQEFVKGGTSLAIYGQSRMQGGWGFHHSPTDPPPPPPATWQSGYWKNDPELRKFTPEEARSEISDMDLELKPFFLPFLELDLFDSDLGSTKASENSVRHDVLATGIPSQSFAIAANPVASLKGNHDMNGMKTDPTLWPIDNHDGRSVGKWLHSDIKNVSTNYLNKVYTSMINLGSLSK